MTDPGIWVALDEGCNSNCHGRIWAENAEEKLKQFPLQKGLSMATSQSEDLYWHWGHKGQNIWEKSISYVHEADPEEAVGTRSHRDQRATRTTSIIVVKANAKEAWIG